MYLYTLIINGREEKFLDEDGGLSRKLIEDSLLGEEFPDYYTDTEKFINEKCTVIKEYIAKPFLYLILTNQHGYDTYDRAVYSAWIEEQAIEMSENNMSCISDKYINSATKIGVSISDDIGEVISSFNAG